MILLEKEKEISIAMRVIRDEYDSSFEDMLQEVDIMKRLGSNHYITHMFGCNTIEKVYFMLLEVAQYGDLRKYLIDKRENVSHCYQ